MLDARADSPLTVNSVLKAFRVLSVFSQAAPRLSLKQIVDELGIDKSTAQRFTHTLLTLGYLDKDPVAKTFGVTVKILDFAHIYLLGNPLISAALPHMIRLRGQTGETINLTVLDGTEVIFVSRILGSHLLSTGVVTGTRLPVYAAATGIAMMSALADSEVAKLLETSDLRAFTDKTVFDPEHILLRLEAARANGYVLSTGDYFANDISLAAPIVSDSGAVLGGISLSVAADRFTASEAEANFAKLVSATANAVSISSG